MLFKLNAGQNSGIVETPLGLEILRTREKENNIVRASHIYFTFKDIATYVDPLKEQKRPRTFINP